MLKKYWDNITPQFKLVLMPVMAYVVAYAAYKLGLELWCVAYGLVY